MSKINDGGPAFPCSNEQLNSGHAVQGITLRDWFAGQGMTLRDWFAGQALAGLLAAKGYHERNVAAQDAYNLADAMISARQSQEGEDA